MTLVVAMNGRESVWMVTDRRLCSTKGRLLRDDARKMMAVETTDGVAILGYAGLGATARGIEPSDWMSAVLRSRNLTLEQALSVLTDAMTRQFPRHCGKFNHDVLVTAIVGKEVRFYTINPNHDVPYIRWTYEQSTRTARFGLGGSGGLYLYRQDKRWRRRLLRLVAAYDREQVSPYAVADELASLNYRVHLSDNSVGPNCIVAWRNRKGGVHKGGGGDQFYIGTTKDPKPLPLLPIIAGGFDIPAYHSALFPVVRDALTKSIRERRPVEVDENKLREKLALLPKEPDEHLR